MNMYGKERLVDFAWNTTDLFVENTGTVRNQTYETYFYPSIKSTCTQIDIYTWGSYNGSTGGVNSDMHVYVILQKSDGSGSWSTLSSASYTWEDGTSGYQTLTMTPTVAEALGRKYRLHLYKNATDGTAIITSTWQILGIHITQ